MAASCVYEVYLHVHRHVALLRERGDESGIADATLRLDALAGAARVAARLGASDANARRPARERHVLCHAVCVETACEEHPAHQPA